MHRRFIMKGFSSGAGKFVNISSERLELLGKLLVDDLPNILRKGVRDWLFERSSLLAEVLLAAEVDEIVGRRSERNVDRESVRWGKQDGSILIAEQRVPIKKPRVRTNHGGSEIVLETYKVLNDREFLNEQAAAKMLSGVSTRRLAETLEKGLSARGVSRQVISERGAADMAKRLEYFQTRTLEDVELLAIFIDGIHIGDDVYVAAMGMDTNGEKHILGFEPGSTEGSVTCKTLIRDLIERGFLKAEENYLFVVDGGKALKKAIKSIFGKRAQIQRCIVHKKRNVTAKLPKKVHEWFLGRFNAAYGKTTQKEAERAFDQLRKDLLLQRRVGAANSLLEGLQDLLTLHRLGINGRLRKSLYSTNCIESVFSAARYYTRNVKRWQGEQQSSAWLAAGLLEAEGNLRRVPGYTQINKLKQALGR
jgi:putative transposase